MTKRRTVAAETASVGRRHDVDRLRMFIVFGLVLFHSGRIFDTLPWYIKNDPTSELVTIAVAFAALWGMPLLFVIAGMGIRFSLRTRTTKIFALERVRRLLIPLVFGVLVIVPPMVWTRLRGDPTYNESYWQFLGRFFDVKFGLADFPLVITADPASGLFQPGHLWFLVVLFAFTMLLLPVIWYLRSPQGLRVIDWLAERSKHFWVIVLAGLPLSLLDAGFGSETGFGGWYRFSYAVFLLYGYLLATDPRFGLSLRKHRWSALVLGLLTFVIVGVLISSGLDQDGVNPFMDHDFGSLAMRLVKGFSGWLCVAAILGFASGSGKQVHAPSGLTAEPTVVDRAAAYASEAVLPFYVLHQTVIVLVGFYVIDWPMNGVAKYLLICLISLAVILAIYDVAVRRTQATRFLFGMKQHR